MSELLQHIGVGLVVVGPVIVILVLLLYVFCSERETCQSCQSDNLECHQLAPPQPGPEGLTQTFQVVCRDCGHQKTRTVLIADSEIV